jgi:membrane-associated phospholipid phosphatase
VASYVPVPMTGKNWCILLICYAGVCAPARLAAQSPDSALPDAPSQVAFSDREPSNSPAFHDQGALSDEANLPDDPGQLASSEHHGGTPASERQAGWHSLPKDFLHDQKQIWLFPTKLAKGKHWVPTIAISGLTAGLIVADPHAMPYFRSHRGNLDDINDIFATSVTTAAVIGVPASLMAAGYARHDEYQVSTAILAGEAYADSAVVNLLIKAITRRQRPIDVAPTGTFHNTFFAGGKSPFKGSSFPSGHAMGAFSVATVIAKRYRNHKWVPWLAYGFATTVSLSRISTLSHFPSDIFLGGALGYAITNYTVLQPRRD